MSIEQLKAAFADSTPGEWTQDDACIRGNGLRVADLECTEQEMPDDEQDANSEFIALAHNMMPLLLEAICLVDDMARGNTEFSELEARADEIFDKLKGK